MRLRVAALALAASGAALGLPGSRPQLVRQERHDISPPLWLLRPVEAGSGEEREPGRIPLEAAPGPVRDPALQSSGSALLTIPLTNIFEGVGQGFVGTSPANVFDTSGADVPDPQGDVGPQHVVQIVNSSIAVFSKSGALLYGPVSTQTVFSGLGGACESSKAYDGIVLYDSLADRWLIATVALGSTRGTGPYFECMAVSRTPDPTGSYNRYAYPFAFLNDYPKFGVWPDAYYASFNVFQDGNAGGSLLNRMMCAIDRARMLAGDVATMQCIELGAAGVSGTVPADLDGMLLPPPGEPGFVVGFARFDSLVVYRFHVDWDAPLNSTVEAIQVPVAPFARPCSRNRSGACVPQAGSSSSLLDALSDRMMFRVAYRNFGSYASLIANHTVTGQAGASSGVRWYEVRDPGGDPFVYQQGTYAPDSNWRWLGSAAIDRAGNIGLGFSISGPQMHPAIGITGHAVTDPPGVMGQGETVISGGGSQSVLSLRWGDYSSLSVDPVDECTFWYTNQYLPFDGAFNWHTRLMTFQLPGCTTAPDFAVWATPARQTIRPSGTATFAIDTGALVGTGAGKTLQLSVVGPAGLSASVAPSAVVVGQQATVTIAADANAAIGEVPFTVRAVAADGTTLSAGGSIAVIDSDFSLDVQKRSVSVGVGRKTEIPFNTGLVFGAPEVVVFSVPHVPRGIVATVDPPYARLAEPGVLRLTGDGIDLAGTGTVRLVASGRLVSHSVTIQVRSLVLPQVRLLLPVARSIAKGKITVSADVLPSVGTTLAAMDLLVDGSRAAPFDPATFTVTPTLLWDTNSADDGPHLIGVGATDADGNRGISESVEVWIQNKNECGCSSDTAGWEMLGLMGAFLAARRLRRRTAATGARAVG